MAPHDSTRDLLLDWIQRVVPCAFPNQLLSANQLKPLVLERSFLRLGDLRAIDVVVEESSSSDAIAVLAFPWVESREDVVELFKFIQDGDRWRWLEVDAAAGAIPEGSVALQVLWQTSVVRKGGEYWESCAMGFAPWPTMPATRLAPCFMLVLWGGGPSPRTLRKRPLPQALGLGDCPVYELDDAVHRRIDRRKWLKKARASEAQTASRWVGEFDVSGNPWWRDTTFVVSADIAAQVLA